MIAGPTALNQANNSAPTSGQIRPQVEPFLASGSEPKSRQSVTRNEKPARSSELMTKRTRKPPQKKAAKPPCAPGYFWRRHGVGWDLRRDFYVTSHDGVRKRKQPYVAHMSAETFREL